MDGLGISLVRSAHRVTNKYNAGIAAPAGLVATAGHGQASLAWSAYSPSGGSASGFYVFHNQRNDFTHARKLGIAADGSSPAFTATGLINDVPHYFWVAVVLPNGLNGTPSAAATATPTTPDLPLAVETFSVTSGDTVTQLLWYAPPAGVTPTGYKVYRNGTLLASVGAGAPPLTYNDSGLTNGTTYAYKVSCTSADGEGPATSEITVMPQVPPPEVPANLAATAGDATVSLTWDTVIAAATYTVHRDGTIAVTGLTTAAWDDTGLINGTAYTYEVIAVNPGGESAASAGASATPQAAETEPREPSDFSVSAGDSSVSLSWGPPDSAGPAATGYNVYRDGYQVTQTTGFSYNDSALNNGTTYHYFVTGTNSSGEGASTATIEATPQAVNDPMPGTPGNFHAASGDSFVALSWDAAYQASTYNLHRNGSYYMNVSDTSLTDVAVTNGTEYTYYVTAVNAFGMSAGSAPVSVIPSHLPHAPEGFSASPGDSSAYLAWSAPSTGAAPASYDIYRLGGKIATVTDLFFNDTGLANGSAYNYYIVSVNDGGDGGSTSSLEVVPLANPLPDAPGAPSASAGDSLINLSWGGAGAAQGYKVYRDGSPVAELTATSWTDTGLTNGTEYTYYVTGVNTTGEGPPSTTVSATPSLVPYAPGNFGGYAGDSSIGLAWEAPSSIGPAATAYNVYRNGMSVTQTSSTYYSEGGLSNGSSYDYFVRALNSNGEGPQTGTITLMPQIPVPDAPTGLGASADNNTVHLSWSASSNAASYNVYRDGTFVTNVTGASFDDTTVSNGTTYTYYVTAVNSAGESSASGGASAMPQRQVPYAPQSFAASAGDGSAALTWSGPDPSGPSASSFNVYRNGGLISSTGNLYFNDSGLSNGSSYDYYVSAVNGAGEGDATSTISVTPQSTLTPPSTPGYLNTSAGDSMVNISWPASDTATSYNLYRDNSFITNTGSLSYDDYGLTNGYGYYYNVTAVNGAGESGWSSTTWAYPNAYSPPTDPPPSAPGSLSASGGDNVVNLSWSSSDTATSYNLYRNSSLFTNTTSLAYDDSGVTNGSSYSYNVTAVNSAGESSWSSTAWAYPSAPYSPPSDPPPSDPPPSDPPPSDPPPSDPPPSDPPPSDPPPSDPPPSDPPPSDS